MALAHIFAALLAVTAGAVAMAASKGERLHRECGMVFVCTMLIMSGTGAVMAVFVPAKGSVIGGVLTFYLVSTAFLTVRCPVESVRRLLTGFLLVAYATGVFAIRFGFEALGGANGKEPPAAYFVFGAVALIAALLDSRRLMAGSIEGAHRLARHLWRMGFAMFIATASLFLGQTRLFPVAPRKSGLLWIPVLLVVLFTIYWLVRVLWRRRGGANATARTRESTVRRAAALSE